MLSKLPVVKTVQKDILLKRTSIVLVQKSIMSSFKRRDSLYRRGELEVSGFDKELMEGDIGKFGWYEGNPVPLDCPMIADAEYDGKDVELNKPKKGGSKKYYVC